MPNKPPAYQHYARDWLVATAGLTLEEQGAFQPLLHYQWIQGPLPHPPLQLARPLPGTAVPHRGGTQSDLLQRAPPPRSPPALTRRAPFFPPAAAAPRAAPRAGAGRKKRGGSKRGAPGRPRLGGAGPRFFPGGGPPAG